MAKRPNPDLVKYIEHHLEKGFEIKNIKRKLAEVGHPIEAIEDATQYVLQKKPELKKKPTKFLIVYGLILILVISGFAYYMWFKGTQQVAYQETVKGIEENQTYKGMTDIELAKLAANNGDLHACSFIRKHNLYYSCINKGWEAGDCSWEIALGMNTEECLQARDAKMYKTAVATKNTSLCQETRRAAECLIELAILGNDIRLCSGEVGCIMNLSLTKKDKSGCYLFSANSSEYKECIWQLALSTHDRSLCNEIPVSEVYSKCSKELANATETADRINKYYSEKVAEKHGADSDLFREVAKDAVHYYKEGLCDLLQGQDLGISLTDYCYLNVAYHRSLDMCGNIKDSKVKDCCSNRADQKYINGNCASYVIYIR